MLRASFVLSVSALVMAGIAYAVTHWGFPPVGFEGALVLGGMFLWLSGLSVVLVYGFCITLGFKQRRAGLIWPLMLSIMAVAGLVLASGLLPV
jgi:hypothetical protein